MTQCEDCLKNGNDKLVEVTLLLHMAEKTTKKNVLIKNMNY